FLFRREKGYAQHRRAVSLGTRVLQYVRAEENAGKTVIVFGRNRVELVIMAAGASERQSEERPADHIDLIVGDIVQQFLFLCIAAAPVANGEHAGRDDAVGIPIPTGWQ